jgi:tRNA/rRNA methyltransferase
MLYVHAVMASGKVRFVLHRPQSADNVGAAARAMKNFGFGRLAIVPPAAWENLPRTGAGETAREDVLARARVLARRASDVLDAVEEHATLSAAVADATWVCGTTSREVEGRPRLDPRALGLEVARRAAVGEVAIVFGEERRGLSDAELELCHAVCSIPTDPAYDSMNLAQSVAVLAYEVAMARAPAERAQPERAEPARHATVEALWERLSVVLAESGYLNPQNPEHILADWRRLLARAEPTQREIELLLAAARALERRLKLGGG